MSTAFSFHKKSECRKEMAQRFLHRDLALRTTALRSVASDISF